MQIDATMFPWGEREQRSAYGGATIWNDWIAIVGNSSRYVSFGLPLRTRFSAKHRAVQSWLSIAVRGGQEYLDGRT